LLDGLEVTTFHGSIDNLQKTYPKAAVKRGRRFVDNGHVVTTAGISAGIDGSLHVVARLLGRRIADQVANYMEYAWSPEASLATEYKYMNPSTNDHGRLSQTGDMQFDEKNYAAAEATYRSLLKEDGSDRDTWSSLGQALRKQGKHTEAADAFVRSAEGPANGNTGYGYYAAATEYAQAGKKDTAIDMLEESARERLWGPQQDRQRPESRGDRRRAAREADVGGAVASGRNRLGTALISTPMRRARCSPTAPL
jgi:tetratricopeptide (TPR) repeat protein